MAAGEDVNRHQAEVRVRVYRTVTLVKQDDGGESRRGIVGESIPYLRYDRGAGTFGRARKDLEHATVIKTNVATYVSAVDE